MKFAVFSVVLGVAMLILGAKMNENRAIKADGTQNVAQSKPCFYTQANALNVRQAPSVESQILQTLPKDAQICVYGEVVNGFLRTEFGYIAAQYLSLNPAPKPTQQVESQRRADSIAKTTKLTQSKILLTSTQKAPQNTQLQNTLHQARVAMESQNYLQAKNLALQINAKNPKNIESWEIFTKALYLEGNKQEAMLILENFLLKHHNDALFRLLEQMQGDKI